MVTHSRGGEDMLERTYMALLALLAAAVLFSLVGSLLTKIAEALP